MKRPSTPKSAAGKVWSADQARRFLNAVAGDRLQALWRLELSTGLRRAEERLAYGPAYEDTGLVFTREDGAGNAQFHEP